MSNGTLFSQLKRLVVGAPIPSHSASHERFSQVTGLAVLSSDALSSVAYATEEILRVLVAAGGIAAMSMVTPIGAIIAALLAIVAFSYRQTIHAYPSGGGAYIVAKDNLGRVPSLVAASALLIDYVLTVSVSIAAGVAAITSAFPSWHLNTVEVALGFVALLAIGNLRGVRESGRIFAAPTYFFIVSILAMLAIGAWRYLAGSLAPVAPPADPLAMGDGLGALGAFALLTAFSNGCTALTGVEALSNGVPAFRPPESRNAARTLITMAALSIAMFLGITFLAHAYGVVPSHTETVVSQIARGTFGAATWPYFAVQAATMMILVLAANTAYADFPRLASILAKDGFLPRQFMNQGDRLAFSNGIIILSVAAAVLLVAFGGSTHALIPLYMIGVFLSFTLSQAGMVVHWLRLRVPGWQWSAAVNGFGALVTGIVLLIVAVTKVGAGAWIVLVMIPTVVMVLLVTRRHYRQVAAELTLSNWRPPSEGGHVVIVPVGGIQKAVVGALRYARSLSHDVRAVYVDIDPAATQAVRDQWETWGQGVPLTVLPSPYRSLMEPLLDYVEQARTGHRQGYVTVILPEFVPRRLWHHLLHNQHALLIKGALLFKPNVVVASVPFHLGQPSAVTEGARQ